MNDEDLEDEELEEFEEEQLQEESEEEAERKRVESTILKNKLKLIFTQLASSGRSSLNKDEKATIKKAKEFENLASEIKKTNLILAANKTKRIYQLISASPVLMYVLVGLLIIILIVCVVAWIASIFPFLFPSEENNGTANAAAGISGKDFYGARMVYKDNEKANLEIIDSYIDYVGNGIESVSQITTANGGELAVELVIDIPMPEEDYVFNNFSESSFLNNYPKMYNAVLELAKSVYLVDNGENYSSGSLIGCVDNILYFGYVQNMEDVLTALILNNTSYTSLDSENPVEESIVRSAIEEQLLNNYYSTISVLRTERLFVKDYILSGDEMMKNITKQNYVAMIFMPKRNVEFTKFSFAVGDSNLKNFTISINGKILKKDDYNLGNSEKEAYVYILDNQNITATEFNDINKSNLSALSTDMSLYEVLKLDDYSKYLDSADSTLFTFKQNGVVVNMENTEAFYFAEFETVWK